MYLGIHGLIAKKPFRLFLCFPLFPRGEEGGRGGMEGAIRVLSHNLRQCRLMFCCKAVNHMWRISYLPLPQVCC